MVSAWRQRGTRTLDAVWRVAAEYPWVVVLAIAALDLVLQKLRPPWPVAGVLDEPAHMFTAAVLLCAVSSAWPAVFRRSALLASVLIDLDHIPIYVHFRPLMAHAARPYTHSLLLAIGVILAGSFLRGRARLIVLGTGSGLVLHLVRDLGTWRAPILWPISDHSFGIPYLVYALALVVSAAAIRWRWWEPGRSKRSAESLSGSDLGERRDLSRRRSI